ncbi:MAG: Homogentisate 1,2-dioxygenase [Chloroflexi bacterium]|nr:Homogentisate 1,2-dioxygenase [Chloroflexota bacterium]
MAETQYEHRGRVAHEGIDMVKHLYNRRSLWGSETMMYRARHPMEWSRVDGTYQNWGIDVSAILPTDASSAEGEAAKLFTSEDLTVWLSRRRDSMPHFFRNCNADELHVVLRGAMVYDTDFGRLEASDGDLIVIPKGITYRVSMAAQSETLRYIYESAPEVFLIPAEMIDHVYGKGRPAVSPERLQYPAVLPATDTPGSYQVRVKYGGAFS